MEFRSFAKVNLGLEITGKRENGYHELRTVFQTISLHDTIEIEENDSNSISLSGNLDTIPWDESNTISRAFELIYGKFGLNQGFDVRVTKRIPPGSGLGGGSSNAAVIIMFIIDYFNLDISGSDLLELGLNIGADVPFFFSGGTMLGEGIGEILTAIATPVSSDIAVLMPGLIVSTHEIFSRINLTKKALKSTMDSFLSSGDISTLNNELEFTTFKLFPELERIKMKMESLGLNHVSMSGTGSALFCFPADAQKTVLKSVFPDIFIGELLDKQTYNNSIGAWPSGKASVFGADIRRFESSRPRVKNDKK